MNQPDVPTLLTSLTRDRLVEIGRTLGVSVAARAKKERQVSTLLASRRVLLGPLLGMLHRDELKAACRVFGLDDSGRARAALVERLTDAAGERAEVPTSYFIDEEERRFLPEVGDVVRVRHRQYLVEEVTPPDVSADSVAVPAHRVRLVGLDDDARGRVLEVLWELELGARVLHSQTRGLDEPEALDDPARFGAYLATLRWHGVTATDAQLFQSPFRAGIRLMNHQLVPLERALELPRANLFIADDVGLGKTIEAGLVLQELRLRQRVDFVLVVCPASICLQWRDELWRRFGLHFEIVNRDFVARRRQERGFGVNPWATHTRFIISHHLLRRPEYRDPLLHHIGERVKKSLLILDEAHVAAPATANRYAVDSTITTVVRDVAPRFENRLFLSATPHNGHSNSFSALLELLDPQRFTRGVPVSPAQRDKVMVRRLKSDLKELGVGEFPDRHVVCLELQHTSGSWQASIQDSLSSETEERDLGEAEPFELELARKFHEYSAIIRERRKGRYVLVRLQQRLLSCVDAFRRTLELHADNVRSKDEDAEPVRTSFLDAADEFDDSPNGLEDDDLDRREAARLAAESRSMVLPQARARALLDEMLHLARSYSDAPDAKARFVLDWIRRHQCPAVRWGGADQDASEEDRTWSGRRLIIFTDFRHTLNYLRRLLETAFTGTDRGSERLLEFRGGLLDADRDELQKAFNAPPDEHPVRILLATDSAREGVNLQGHCHDLIHFDVPWNPAKLEQRNGRIDRTLQPESDVYCHYFVYPQRPEDRVLDTLVRKVDVVKREVGSLGTVIFDAYESALENGIDEEAAARLDEAEQVSGRRDVAQTELESQRQLRSLERQIDEAGKILNRSRKASGMRPDLLRRVVDEALSLAGAAPLEALGNDVYRLPDMPASWQATVDTLRPRRERGEPPWEWRQREPLPLVFEPPNSLRQDRVHLHLEHPLVKRLLSRFLAQGFRHDDLSRVSVVRDPEDARVHALAFARLSLFGPGATRLHDELVSVAAPLADAGSTVDAEALEILDENAEARLVDRMWRLLADPSPDGVTDAIHERLLGVAAPTFEALWPHLREEADSLAHSAQERLKTRGESEAADLRQLLEDQRRAIQKESARQMTFEFATSEKEQLRQWENDRRYMADRLERIDQEIESEPPQLKALYEVALRRLEPVGLIFLWPTTR